MIIASMKTGLRRAGAAKRMVLTYFLANLFCGLVLALPLRRLLDSTISNTVLGEPLGGRIDMNFLMDLIFNHKDFIVTWRGLILIVPAFYLLINIFLSGGALSVLAGQEKYSTTLFWSGAAKYFGRFVRLWLMALPVFVIFFLMPFVEEGVTRVLFGADPYQYVTYWARWVRVALFGGAALLSYMFFDYARIYSVLRGEPRMRFAWRHGLKFLFENLRKTFLLAASLGLIGIIGMIVYNFFADRLFAANMWVLLLLFLLQQTFMVFRMFMKVATFAAQANFYQSVELARATPPMSDMANDIAEGEAI
jgi:hypothetical protein